MVECQLPKLDVAGSSPVSRSNNSIKPFRLLPTSVAGWLGQQQRDAIAYPREENRVRQEQPGNKRVRLNDDRRRAFIETAGVRICRLYNPSLICLRV